MEFSWDPDKAASNFEKHEIDFQDAAYVFADPFRIEREDARRDYGEIRYQTIGMVNEGLLFVVYTSRSEDEEICHIISARKAESRERKEYHEG